MTSIRPTPSLLATRDLGPAPEREVARDLLKHGAYALPVLAGLGFLGWGTSGLASVAFATLLVLANFWLAAALLGWAARISLAFLMGMSLAGFVVRLGLISVAVLAVRNQGWVEPFPLGITLVIAHLGLLLWEVRYVSASLAFPGLKPSEEK